MQETYYASTYWLARQETAERCAQRAEDFFQLLGAIEPAWEHWFESADSFEEARELRLETDATTLMRIFERKRNRIAGGVSLWTWTGDDPAHTTSFDAVWGSSSRALNNYSLFTPPAQGPLAERVLTANVLTAVLRAMALAWDPEWGIATSNAHREKISEHSKPGTFVGWVTYFSRLRGAVPPLPAPVRMEPVEDKGTLVILTPERFSAAQPEHVALAASVHEVLAGVGLLRPLQPWPAR